jgi:hypothetical protein
LSSASAKSGISTFLQLLQFGISSSLQFLQFGIRVQFLQKIKIKIGVIFCLPLLQNLVFRLSFSFCNLVFLSVSAIVLVFHLLFSFCNLVSASTIWYFCLVSAIVLVFCLLFSVYNLVFELSFCKKNLEWYFVFRFCKIWYFDFPSASVMIFTTKEIVWLRWLLADMRVFFSHPTPMNCDNQSSIQIAHNSVFMSELSTLRSIFILLVIISSMAPVLCLLFILPCRLQISLPRRIPYFVFVF